MVIHPLLFYCVLTTIWLLPSVISPLNFRYPEGHADRRQTLQALQTGNQPARNYQLPWCVGYGSHLSGQSTKTSSPNGSCQSTETWAAWPTGTKPYFLAYIWLFLYPNYIHLGLGTATLRSHAALATNAPGGCLPPQAIALQSAPETSINHGSQHGGINPDLSKVVTVWGQHSDVALSLSSESSLSDQESSDWESSPDPIELSNCPPCSDQIEFGDGQ